MNPLHLHVGHINGYSEEKGVNKYLVFDSGDENNKLLKNTIRFLMELETKSNKYPMMSVIMKNIT